MSVWASSDILQLTWHAKWTLKGLSPIRPVILLEDDLVIPAESGVPVAKGGKTETAKGAQSEAEAGKDAQIDAQTE